MNRKPVPGLTVKYLNSLIPEDRELVHEMLHRLNEREYYVFEQRLRGKTLRDIGLVWDISPERVRQIEGRNIRRLKYRVRQCKIWPPALVNPPPAEDHTSLSDLELSTRTHNVLANLGVHTIGDILLFTEADLRRQPNFGRKSLNELRQVLANHKREMKAS